MNLKEKSIKLNFILKKYQHLWDNEILETYPRILDSYPKDWLDALHPLSEDELFLFDTKNLLNNLSGLKILIDELHDLTKLEKIEIHEEKLEDWAYAKVKSKKKHEISILAPIIKELQTSVDFEQIVDIGGGVGHLSRICSHYYFIPSISIDRDKEFQLSGNKRLQKYRKLSGAKDVTFLHLDIKSQNDANSFFKIYQTKSATIGLHACGSLSNFIIETGIKFQNNAILSFGCCYHKLDTVSDYPISKYYREKFDLKLPVYALTLASRAHKTFSRENFRNNHRVKNYRYALHLFMYHHLKIKNCYDVGEINVREYYKPFNEYVINKLKNLKISHQFSDEFILNFYHSKENQKLLKEMYLCNLIRYKFGRVLEVFISIDRALKAEEANYQVSLKEYFNEEISPRNIGLLAIKK
jgi:hypothetical protein